ncbi:MAG: Sir2 family NAD-dependent protein deacetylase [Myxococcota bacterium]
MSRCERADEGGDLKQASAPTLRMSAPLELHRYRRIVVLTGAGVSVPSGLRPYRGPGGLWTESPELTAMATLAAAQADPMSTWRAFGSFRKPVVDAVPNEAHAALARAEQSLEGDAELIVLTQNIDGLHQRAGSTRVVELHGNLLRTKCSNNACDLPPFGDDTQPDALPLCPRCGSPLRPDIVLFDEPMPAKPEWDAKRALRDCDLFVAVGTSGTVSPASNFVRSAEYAGARTVFVNLEPLDPPNPAFHESHLGPAEQLLPTLFGV